MEDLAKCALSVIITIHILQKTFEEDKRSLLSCESYRSLLREYFIGEQVQHIRCIITWRQIIELKQTWFS